MINETTKKCRVCLKHKPLNQMKKRADKLSGVDTICKPCCRDKEYFRVHGVERPKDLSIIFKLIEGVKHKRCPDCSEYKPYDSFCKNKATQNGVGTRCFPCTREQKKQYRLQNVERARQLNRDWIKRNYEKNKLLDKIRGDRYRASGKHKIARERYIRDNPDKVELQKKKSRLVSKLHVSNISERYVRSTLGARSTMKGSEFPQELVKTQQELMKLRRFIKENII